MPVGRYRVMDGEGRVVGTEDFRCAPGPAGWRYFADIETSDPEPHRERIDYVVDGSWRPVRLTVGTGTHSLVLRSTGDELVGERDGEPLEIPFGPEMEIDYLSPSFNAVTANRLGGTRDIEVVYLEPVTCEPVPARQRYELVEPEDAVRTPVGEFRAPRWRYSALPDGWTGQLWVAGDVVVAFERLFELEAYEPGSRGPFPA
jgi:hypothetical protein